MILIKVMVIVGGRYLYVVYVHIVSSFVCMHDYKITNTGIPPSTCVCVYVCVFIEMITGVAMGARVTSFGCFQQTEPTFALVAPSIGRNYMYVHVQVADCIFLTIEHTCACVWLKVQTVVTEVL